MQINFIPDEVLKLTNETDLLGTRPYADTIFEIVDKCEGKKNIGLFGSWGSGKSTILSTFESLIDKHNTKKGPKGKKEVNKSNKIGYFEFDAWKYSKDDFRRSFLIELTRKFDIGYEKKLQKLLYSESSFENPDISYYRFNKLSISNWIIIVFVVFGLTFYYMPVLDMYKDIKVIISMLALIISLLSTAAKNTINKYKVVVKENKLVEPERFEAIFDEIVSEITKSNRGATFVHKWIKSLKKKPEYKKIVIVIDNLDRCDDENLLVTLNTIKNFLEHNKVIFVLPVDEKGISAFLSKRTDNTDEYLRKIFHLIIRVKEFSNKELFEFTVKINEAYNLGLNSSSIRIICYEFNSNPRKIIQFLNNYQSEMRLIDEQSKLGYIKGSYIKNHLSFFIKLLIIKYEWRSLYDKILYDKNLFNKINDVITTLEPDDNGLYLINRTNVKLNDVQRNFFFSTQEIHCSKIDPFILNIDLDKNIPDEIEGFIRNANYIDIIEYLDNDEIGFTEYELLQKINEVFSNLTFKHREYSFIALPILKLIINFILDDKQEKFKTALIEGKNEYRFLKSLFKNRRIENLFEKFDFEKLTLTAKWFCDNLNDDLFNSYINYFNKNLFERSNKIEKEEEKIAFFFRTFNETNKISEVKDSFSEKLESNLYLSKIDELKNYSLASKVIKPSTFKAMAQTVNDSDVDDLYKNNLALICESYIQNNQEDNITREKLVNYRLNRLADFYNDENIEEDLFEDYEYYFKNLNNLIGGFFLEIELSSTFQTAISNINSYLFARYNDTLFNEEKLFNLYEEFFELIKNFIFFTKGFNHISYRTTFFERYLEKNISKKISLKINDILFEDVTTHSAYEYPFSETLIDFYLDSRIGGLPFAKTLILMLEKSNDGKGLNKSQIRKIILMTINYFSIYSNSDCISYMMRLKKSVGNVFLDVLNSEPGLYEERYINKVKLLEDKWFYGESIFNYLESSILSSKEGAYSSFKGKLGVITRIFTIEETIVFIEELIQKSDEKVYKWLRLSFNILPKKVFDIYLSNLIDAHIAGYIGHNNFFEWIIKIPRKYFYKSRKRQFVKYLSELHITHKTYAPKKEKALNHLKQ